MSRTREGTDEFSEYTEEETGRGWRKLTRTLNGHTFLVYGSKTEDYIKAILANEVVLKLNDMSDRMEIVTDNGPRPVNDIDDSIILARLLDFGMRNEGYMRKSMHTLAARNRYHPVREYLQSLEWDGGNHFDALMDHLDMSSELATVFWRKFLIGSIAKALTGAQNYMLVLKGAQGRGKSRLVRWLCPLPHLFHEGAIVPDNKDDQIKLIENWFWEVAELEGTVKRAAVSALKNFITMRNVGVRVPYGRYAINKTAAASMVGTINDDGTGFLNDRTGNRRFAVVEISDIDWAYETIDKDQLWAELYAAYLDGEGWELSHHEMEVQREINELQMTISPLEELLMQHFIIDPSQTGKFSATMNILDKLETMGLKGDQFKNKMELTSILKKAGLKSVQKRTGGVRVRGYEGIWYKDGITVEVEI